VRVDVGRGADVRVAEHLGHDAARDGVKLAHHDAQRARDALRRGPGGGT